MITFTEVTILYSFQNVFYVNTFYFRFIIKHKIMRCHFFRSKIFHFYSVHFTEPPFLLVVLGPTIHHPNFILEAYGPPLLLYIIFIGSNAFIQFVPMSIPTSIMSSNITLEFDFKYSYLLILSGVAIIFIPFYWQTILQYATLSILWVFPFCNQWQIWSVRQLLQYLLIFHQLMSADSVLFSVWYAKIFSYFIFNEWPLTAVV